MTLTLFGLGFSYLGRDLKDVVLLTWSKRFSPNSRTSLDCRGMSSLRTLDRLVELYGVIAGFLNVLVALHVCPSDQGHLAENRKCRYRPHLVGDRGAVVGRVLDESRHFFGVRNVDRMAGSLSLHFVAVRAFCVHALQVGIDGLVGLGHHVPTRL